MSLQNYLFLAVPHWYDYAMLIFVPVLFAVWVLHPKNFVLMDWHRKEEFTRFSKQERKHRLLRKPGSKLTASPLQQRIWRMSEYEFEEFCCDLWKDSEWWWEWRHTRFCWWAQNQRFERKAEVTHFEDGAEWGAGSPTLPGEDEIFYLSRPNRTKRPLSAG
jgi:hypothetical protein